MEEHWDHLKGEGVKIHSVMMFPALVLPAVQDDEEDNTGLKSPHSLPFQYTLVMGSQSSLLVGCADLLGCGPPEPFCMQLSLP